MALLRLLSHRPLRYVAPHRPHPSGGERRVPHISSTAIPLGIWCAPPHGYHQSPVNGHPGYLYAQAYTPAYPPMPPTTATPMHLDSTLPVSQPQTTPPGPNCPSHSTPVSTAQPVGFVPSPIQKTKTFAGKKERRRYRRRNLPLLLLPILLRRLLLFVRMHQLRVKMVPPLKLQRRLATTAQTSTDPSPGAEETETGEIQVEYHGTAQNSTAQRTPPSAPAFRAVPPSTATAALTASKAAQSKKKQSPPARRTSAASTTLHKPPQTQSLPVARDDAGSAQLQYTLHQIGARIGEGNNTQATKNALLCDLISEVSSLRIDCGTQSLRLDALLQKSSAETNDLFARCIAEAQSESENSAFDKSMKEVCQPFPPVHLFTTGRHFDHGPLTSFHCHQLTPLHAISSSSEQIYSSYVRLVLSTHYFKYFYM